MGPNPAHQGIIQRVWPEGGASAYKRVQSIGPSPVVRDACACLCARAMHGVCMFPSVLLRVTLPGGSSALTHGPRVEWLITQVIHRRDLEAIASSWEEIAVALKTNQEAVRAECLSCVTHDRGA